MPFLCVFSIYQSGNRLVKYTVDAMALLFNEVSGRPRLRWSRGHKARGQGQEHKKIRGQGQPFGEQIFSRPRTEISGGFRGGDGGDASPPPA